MGAIKFNKQNNRLKRVLTGEDHYSGLLFYVGAVPAGVVNAINEIGSVDDLAALGITGTHEDLSVRTIKYHVEELFRVNPNAVLFLGVYAMPTAAHTFTELEALRVAAKGKLRQVGVWTKKAFDIAQIGALQQQYTESFAAFAPHELFYSPNLYNVTAAALPDLSALTSPNVHLVIGQDGKGAGAALFQAAATFSIGVVGATIGAVSLAKKNENIGWVEKFNMAVDGGELDVPALSNGVLVSTLSGAITKSGGTLDTRRLIFLKTYPGVSGVYFNDSHGACAPTSDFAYAEDNMVLDKAIRGIYTKLAPQINGPVLLDKGTGKLSYEYVQFLQLEAGKALEEMEKDGELSGYTVTIDADQDVNATSQIVIEVSNTKIGVSRNFIVNIGY